MGGLMMPLALYGQARTLGGALKRKGREVIRLKSPTHVPEQAADVAVVRSAKEAEAAADHGFKRLWLLGDDETLRQKATLAEYQVPDRFDYLADGDIIGIEPSSGRFRVHFRQTSAHNAFLVTERCNHYCLMCSQPPRNIDDRWILDEIEQCLPLIDKGTRSLGFTGGEPLLEWKPFIATLEKCRDLLPDTAVHVLSNGRAFVQNEVADAWAGMNHPNLMVGIPVYAAVDNVHDYVVQAEGAFDETVLGILKLKDRGARVEVRVVLHAITVKRLVETCRWLARNLPFVDHVALMGLENTGFAIANDKLLWVDPIDYQNELTLSVEALDASGVNVSIYNLPLCVIAPSIRKFAAKSISDWKNGFPNGCELCEERTNCCGLFTSGRPKTSRGIRPIVKSGNGSVQPQFI